MLVGALPSWLALCWISLTRPSFVLAQDDYLHFTSGVTNPAPQPGQPFTITWAGGDPSATVYIVLNYLFPDTPNQDIEYGQTDILSNAPNNGSWVYNVPGNLFQGRYTFSIGINPFLQSDATPPFTIVNSQTGSDTPQPSPTTTGSPVSYNGCGLIPLPDFTYTGYQAPCAYTTDGHVETIYPIVPESLSSSFFGSDGVFRTNTYLASLITPPGLTAASTSIAGSGDAPSTTAIASDIYAQALQCQSPVTPEATAITAGDTTTVFTSVRCSTAGQSVTNGEGVCHTSGYATFSVSGTRSVCCPNGWATTPLASQLYCFTSAVAVSKRDSMWSRNAPRDASAAEGPAVTSLTGLAFTIAGMVENEATPASAAGGAAQTSPGKSASRRLVADRSLLGVMVIVAVLCIASC